MAINCSSMDINGSFFVGYLDQNAPDRAKACEIYD